VKARPETMKIRSKYQRIWNEGFERADAELRD
jgi:hypothetical protein